MAPIAALLLSLTSSQVDLRTVTHRGAQFDVVEVSLHSHAVRLAWRAAGMRLKDVEGEVRTDAGIFEPGFRPTGLLVSGGKALAPLNRRAGHGNFYLAPNGVFAIRRGQAVIEETAEYDGAGVTEATQSGPLLLRRGKIHPAFRAGSVNRAIRSAVGVRAGDRVVLVLSRGPVTLWALAELFRDRLGCADALYLDGAISALWAKGRDRALEAGPFAGVLVVEPRLR